MDLQQKFQILINKLNAGHIDDVIFEATYLNKKHPKQEVFYNLLSLAYQTKGEYEKSISLLENALKRSKNNFNFLNNLGLSYYKKRDYIKAEQYFLKVLEIKPKYINTINNLATLYDEINQFEKSEKLFKKSLEINSEIVETNYNFASLLQSVGKLKEAKNYYQKILKLNKNFTKADRSLAMLENYTKDNKHIDEMENKIKIENLHKNNIADLSFALGKVYEDIKDYEKSFFYIEKANKLKKNLIKYNIQKDQNLFKKIKDFYQNNDLKKISSTENEKKNYFYFRNAKNWYFFG